MVITKLSGGLGNQMFQYAAGRRLAYVRRSELKLDISEVQHNKIRPYSLGALKIKENIATPEEIKALTIQRPGILEQILSKMTARPSKLAAAYTKEKHFQFDRDVLDLPDGMYLDGYWQSEKYFKDIEDVIREEFTIIIEPDSLNKKFSDEIKDSDSVSIHVRRGDYISNEETNKHHGSCPLEYYITAIDVITGKIKAPHFFVFSDDPEWVKHNFQLNHRVTYIDFNSTEKAYEDLRLMSLCKHHIIANSSFSWWGAWLNRHPQKIVCAPEKWLNDPDHAEKYINFVTDLLPPGWLRM